MEEHIDSIIKSIFTALKKEYPDLKIAGCIVVADQFNYESANQKPLEEIYGKNNKDYILSTFKSARKYAPSSCKLYLEDLFFARENSMKEVCDCVKSIREHGDYIDGIAMNVLIFENWKDESAFFDAAVRDIKALGQIDLILTDTAVSVSPAYDSEALCRCYTAGFFDFFRNAKDISAVILRDNDRMLDGPLCLCEVKGFADSLRDAINQYQSLPAKTVRNLLSPYFKTGKTITMPDTGLDESGVKDYVRDQFDLASLEYLLTLESCLSYTWKAGDPIKIEFNSLNKDYLSYCEKNRIPVVIGPLLSPAPLPLAYYKDADGALVSAEEMDARMKIIISSFFTALSENYPDLIIEDCIVCADLFNSANGAERPLETIYGKDNTDYIINTFKLTKQYAPNGCRLYLQDIFLPVENSMTKTCALAKKILAASDTKSALIDGIAMCVGTTTAEAWKTEAAYFDAAVKEIAAANMNLILTDVSVSVRPAYDDDARCAAFTACFTDIIRQAKNISAVILEDHHQMLDGPRTLSHLKGFGVALQNAVDAQAAVLPEQKSGDANCDGSVDVSDAVIIARFIAEDSTLKISSQGKLNADADRNATLDGQDVIYVLKVIAKLI